MHINDLLWIAGILEGEGCFRYRKDTKSPLIALNMTDEDTVSKFCQLVNTTYSAVKPEKEHWKMTYLACLSGFKAYEMMEMLLPYMCNRRASKIFSIMRDYRNRTFIKKEYTDIDIDEVLYMRNELKMSFSSIGRHFNVSHHTVIKWIKDGMIFVRPKVKESDLEVENLNEANVIYWIAGILDGEGSFQKGAPSSKNIQKITITMTDEDVIEKVGRYFGCSYSSWQDLKNRRKDGGLFKKTFIISFRGKRALAVMKELKPLMSARRQIQIQEALDDYDPLCMTKRHMGLEKFTYEEAVEIKRLRDSGMALKNIANLFGGGSHNTITRVITSLETRSPKEWMLSDKIVKNKKQKVPSLKFKI